MKVLYAPNMCHVYIAGNEFGETHYIVAESWEDAYEEYLSYEASIGNICDHGGEISDEERMNHGGCDCTMNDQGQWVYDVNLWMKELRLSVDMFMLAAEAFEDSK
jgi:hypothetical protein